MQKIQHQANLPLQILLQFNVYLAVAYCLLYGFHIIFNISDLLDFHGICIILGYITVLAAEFWRLLAGYSGNLRAQAGDLTIFLVLSPLIQMPLFSFLLLSAKTKIPLLTILTACIFGFMIAEFLLGFYTWRQLSNQQIELYKLKRQISLLKQIESVK